MLPGRRDAAWVQQMLWVNMVLGLCMLLQWLLVPGVAPPQWSPFEGTPQAEPGWCVQTRQPQSLDHEALCWVGGSSEETPGLRRSCGTSSRIPPVTECGVSLSLQHIRKR